MVRHTDPIYEPVLLHLAEHPMRMVVQEIIPDKEMYFGRGELTVYREDGPAGVDQDLMPVMEKFMRGLIAVGGYK